MFVAGVTMSEKEKQNRKTFLVPSKALDAQNMVGLQEQPITHKILLPL